MLETLAAAAVPALGQALGGGRTSQSVSQQTSLSVNPAFVFSFGGGTTSATPSGNASGSAPSSANSAGNDGGTPSYLPQTQPRITTPAYTSASAIPGDAGGGDMTMLLIAGAVALLLLPKLLEG